MSLHTVDRIAYELQGEGEAVLMIHGLGGSSNVWTPLMAAFSRNTALRLDLPGSARSSRVEGPLSIARYVAAGIRVMGAAGIERAHVIGHSMGTIVAAHLAASEPSMVKSLALFGPLLAPPDPARTALRARGAKARDEGLQGMHAIAETLAPASISTSNRTRKPVALAYVRESLMRQDPEGYARSCEALADAQPADVSMLDYPVLLVTGDEDAVAPAQSVRLMADKFKHARVEVLRDCGHWTPTEQPEECMRLLERFYA